MTDSQLERKIYTVTQLNSEIKGIIEPPFDNIWLEGEVSNYKLYPSGHAYFSLKDETSSIPAIFFNFKSEKFRLYDGLKIICRGRVTLYVKSGRHQIVLTFVEPKGKGALQLAFEQLKTKLQKEGLFDQKHKIPIPLLPSKIGVVTSPTGAAIRDILTVINRRFSNVRILIYPVSVQGENAKYEISAAIKYLNTMNEMSESHHKIDVLLVGRGGGSYEDLWAFNEEVVARAIFASKIPIISCVGHEIDFTIADFVADLRAPTPSAAAELVVRNKAELHDRIRHNMKMLSSRIRHIMSICSEKIGRFKNNKYFKNPNEYFSDYAQLLDELSSQMVLKMTGLAETKTHKLELLKSRVSRLNLTAIAESIGSRLNNINARMLSNFKNLLFIKDQKMANFIAQLHSLSPLSVLARGYSMTSKVLPDGRRVLLKNSKDVKSSDRVEIKLHEGIIEAEVKKTVEKKEEDYYGKKCR